MCGLLLLTQPDSFVWRQVFCWKVIYACKTRVNCVFKANGFPLRHDWRSAWCRRSLWRAPINNAENYDGGLHPLFRRKTTDNQNAAARSQSEVTHQSRSKQLSLQARSKKRRCLFEAHKQEVFVKCRINCGDLQTCAQLPVGARQRITVNKAGQQLVLIRISLIYVLQLNKHLTSVLLKE